MFRLRSLFITLFVIAALHVNVVCHAEHAEATRTREDPERIEMFLKSHDGRQWVGVAEQGTAKIGTGTFYRVPQSKLEERKASTYKGQYQNGLFHGYGTLRFPDGYSYVGDFKKGLRHGYGTSTWPSKDVYKGSWKNDLRHGQGTYTFADGVYYKGEFANDLRHGDGEFHWPTGDAFVGTYKEDLRDGYGTYFYANGDVYRGGWKQDVEHGKGEIEHPDGTVDKGEWMDGERVEHKKKDKIVIVGKVDEAYLVNKTTSVMRM